MSMRLKLCFGLVLAIVVCLSCGKKMHPMEYNKIIVSTHDMAWQLLNHKQQEIYDYQSTQGETAKIIIDSLYLEFDSIIHRLDSINYPSEATDFHKSTIVFYKYIKDSVIYLYYETLKYEPTSERWYESWEKIEKALDGRASQLENQLITEQVKFAKRVSINY